MQDGIMYYDSVKTTADLKNVQIKHDYAGVFVQASSQLFIFDKRIGRWVESTDYAMLQTRSRQYRHDKTGRIYNVESFNIVNGTNAQDGQTMVLYSLGGKQFVRELEEFLEKFTKVYDVDYELPDTVISYDAGTVSTQDS